jgi:hypothetical protein
VGTEPEKNIGAVMGLLDQINAYIQANTPRNTRPAVSPATVINEGLLNPNQFNAVAANRFKDSLFGGLGIVPGVGDVASGMQAVDFWNRGEKLNAGLAGLGALPFIPALGAHTAYHSSPHKFDKFDMSKIGTFSESPEVARSYAKADIPPLPNLDNGERYWLRYGLPPESGKSRHVQHGFEEDGISVMGDYSKLGNDEWTQSKIFSMTAGEMGTRPLYVVAGKQRNHNPNIFGESGYGSDGEPLLESARVIREATPMERYLMVRDMENVATKEFGFEEIPDIFKLLKSEDPRNLYKVDIPDEAIPRMLDWDKPLSEQHPDVQPVLRDMLTKARKSFSGIDPNGNPIGGQVHHLYAQHRGGNANAVSEELAQAGIPGIRYLDGSSRTAGEGTSNYVLFDDQLPRILEVNGKPTGLLSYADEAKKANK